MFIFTILLAYVGLCILLFLFQSRLLYFPYSKLVSTPDEVGLGYTPLKLTTQDDVRLSAWYIPAMDEQGVVLFCHGNGGNISYLVETIWQYHRLGLSTLVFDYRGYGESEGTPTEEGTYRDSEAAWRYLVKQRSIPPSRIVVIGRSLGGAVAAWLAQKHTPGALVLESPFVSVPDIAADVYPYFPVRWMSRFNYGTVDYVKNVKCPVLVVHSPDDEIIPYEHGRRVFEQALEPKGFLEIRGSHNEGFHQSEGKYMNALGEFIAKHLRK